MSKWHNLCLVKYKKGASGSGCIRKRTQAMKKKILIVDDSQAILHLLSSYLEQKGYEVATAEDGLKALDVL
jgi:PleD family two-component response regulator